MGLCVLHGPGMGRRMGQGCGDPGSGHRQGLKTLHVCRVYRDRGSLLTMASSRSLFASWGVL